MGPLIPAFTAALTFIGGHVVGLFLIVFSLSQPAVAAETKTRTDIDAQMVGAWGCTIQYMAGIQRSKAGAVPFVGQITPRARYFILTIRPAKAWERAERVYGEPCTGKRGDRFVAEMKPGPFGLTELRSKSIANLFVGGVFGCTAMFFMTTKGTFTLNAGVGFTPSASYTAQGTCKKLK